MGLLKGVVASKLCGPLHFTQKKKAKYGPNGDEIGQAFTSSVAPGRVVGFHGRSGAYLDAIGVHMEYF